MRLVAGLACCAAGMLFRDDLWKELRPRGIRFVAASAKDACIREGSFRCGSGRIARVNRSGTVAGFAPDARMSRSCEYLCLIVVADRACSAAGIRDWPGSHVIEGACPEVAILSDLAGTTCCRTTANRTTPPRRNARSRINEPPLSRRTPDGSSLIHAGVQTVKGADQLGVRQANVNFTVRACVDLR
jgi:hypothetical protein